MKEMSLILATIVDLILEVGLPKTNAEEHDESDYLIITKLKIYSMYWII